MAGDFDLEAKRAEQAAARTAAAGRVVDLDTTIEDPDTAHLDPAAIDACGLCDADGYNASLAVCHHVDHAAVAARHMPDIRAALEKGHQP